MHGDISFIAQRNLKSLLFSGIVLSSQFKRNIRFKSVQLVSMQELHKLKSGVRPHAVALALNHTTQQCEKKIMKHDLL
jgi:hypothetical protein